MPHAYAQIAEFPAPSCRTFCFGKGGKILLFGILVSTIYGCANPAKSSLPPSEIAAPGVSVPDLPKGQIYANEKGIPLNVPVSPGDIVEVHIQASGAEETMSATVQEDGKIRLSFFDVAIAGLTASQAERKIEKEAATFFRTPRVFVRFKEKRVSVKRVFVVGEVMKPGVVPMNRNMTVLQAIAEVGNYKESAVLEEIRVLRGNQKGATVLTADIARLLTYGDWSRNLNLEENDIVYVPRSKFGDAEQWARQNAPVCSINCHAPGCSHDL